MALVAFRLVPQWCRTYQAYVGTSGVEIVETRSAQFPVIRPTTVSPSRRHTMRLRKPEVANRGVEFVSLPVSRNVYAKGRKYFYIDRQFGES